ncbi:LCP family protein [Paenibacillus sp. GYB003]|uniref:LCP family protein n=1 Tax=Paenibacillus sp. GYB003 TaxID=2994392 RepID=UPI002F960E82
MNRKRICIGLGVAAVLLLAGLKLYDSLAPSRHFRGDRLPVLAAPAPPAASPTVASPAQSAEAGEAPTTPGPGSAEAEAEAEAGFNVLLLGIDSRDKEGAGRSDVMIVAHVDPDERSIGLVSVPRDTRVALPGVGQTKLNHAYFLGELRGGDDGGVRASIEAVSRLLQIPIHFYVKTDFRGFADTIDAIQGVDVELSDDMLLSGTGTVLRKGVRHLDGDTALQFVRERYSLAGGDFDRQADQAALIKAVVAKMLSGEQLARLPGIVKKAKAEFVETNLSAADIASLALLFKDAGDLSFRHATLPGRPVTEEDPLIGSKLWYWSADAEQVAAISRDYLR